MIRVASIYGGNHNKLRDICVGEERGGGKGKLGTQTTHRFAIGWVPVMGNGIEEDKGKPLHVNFLVTASQKMGREWGEG